MPSPDQPLATRPDRSPTDVPPATRPGPTTQSQPSTHAEPPDYDAYDESPDDRPAPGMAVLLAIVTLGIHPLVWTRRARARGARGPLVTTFAFCLIGLLLAVLALAAFVTVTAMGGIRPFSATQPEMTRMEATLLVTAVLAAGAAVLAYIPGWTLAGLSARRIA